MGRVTYEEMAAFWPTSTSDYARPMNEIPKVVFSKTLDHADWAETRIAREDLREEIERLKREPGNDLIAYGGARFDQALSRLGLVDEYRLMIQPAALGAGLPCSRICRARCTSSSLKRRHTQRASPFTSTGRARLPPTSRSIRTSPNRSGSANSDLAGPRAWALASDREPVVGVEGGDHGHAQNGERGAEQGANREPGERELEAPADSCRARTVKGFRE
jgi:dihydrofolate reductase